MRVKYIVIDETAAVLTSGALTHADLARVAQGKPINGAGFCSVDETGDDPVVHVWGESIGLRIKSRPEDARFIKYIFSHDVI